MGRLSSTESGEGGMTPVSEEAVIESALGLCLQCIGFLMRRGARLGAGLLSLHVQLTKDLNFLHSTIQFIQYTIQIHVSGELFTPFLFCFVFVVPMINVAKFIQFAAQKKT